MLLPKPASQPKKSSALGVGRMSTLYRTIVTGRYWDIKITLISICGLVSSKIQVLECHQQYY
jgi:hypothetical protein